MKYCFGIDVGGTTVKCGLFTKDGEVVKKWEIPTDRSEKGKNVPSDIAAAIRAAMKEEVLCALKKKRSILFSPKTEKLQPLFQRLRFLFRLI